MKRMKLMMAGLIVAAMAGSSVFPISAGAAEPEGTVTYSLPSTTISLTVDAVQEKFYAGPYARFATKYLGISARETDQVKYHIGKVEMTPYVEADLSARYRLPQGCGVEDRNIMALSSAGLVALENGGFGKEGIWRFPAATHGDFSGRGVSSNLKSESATLFGARRKNASKKVLQEMTMEKSLEQKAREAADMVLDLRNKRYQIITGDTDATYSGEAMGAAIAELQALEEEYLSLFIGYTEYQSQKAYFDIIPEKSSETQMLIAFRLSDTEGLMPATTASGRPVVMQIVPDKIAAQDAPLSKKEQKQLKDASFVHYRIPASCTINIMEGGKLLLQGRMPVYQMGVESTLPVTPVKKK